MCLQSIKFGVALCAPPKLALIRPICQMYVRVTSQMGFTHKSFLTLTAFVWFVISLKLLSIKLS